ncbi:MAG: 30S ribosomal protein S20, partial [Planctomycetota bacterium]
MGHSLSADKRERQNLKRHHRNRGNMILLRKELKGVTAAIGKGGTDAPAALSKGFQALDRAARKNTIPKKRADRKKARLALALVRAAKAAGAPPAAQPAPVAETAPAAGAAP